MTIDSCGDSSFSAVLGVTLRGRMARYCGETVVVLLTGLGLLVSVGTIGDPSTVESPPFDAFTAVSGQSRLS